MPKTGTSSIQLALGVPGGHHWLMLLAAEGPVLRDYMRKLRVDPLNLQIERTRAEKRLEELASSNTVMSSEFLFGSTSKAFIDRLHTHLSKHFDTIQVVVYLQDQVDHMPSRVSQRIKSGQSDWNKILKFEDPLYEYDKVCEMWSSQFDLVVRDYGAQSDVVTDFFALAGDKEAPKLPRQNRSLGRKGLEVMLLVNKCCAPGNETTRRRIVKSLAELDFSDERFEIPDALKKQIRDRYRDHNSQLTERWLNGEPLVSRSI
jgi:hypothetical protein